MAMMRSAAGASVASQLVEMRLGTRDRFDFQQVISAAASQYVGAKISVPYEATPLGTIAKVAANTLADAAINSALYRQAPNFEQMAISAIGGQVGSYAGEMAGRWFDNHFTSAPASAPIAIPQRNRAQAKPSDVPQHVRVAERSKVVEKKLSGSHVDATNSAWGKELSGHAQERMATRQTRWQAEIHKRANQTTSTQSVVSQRENSYANTSNKHSNPTSTTQQKPLSGSAAKVVSALTKGARYNGTNQVGDVLDLAKDAYNITHGDLTTRLRAEGDVFLKVGVIPGVGKGIEYIGKTVRPIIAAKGIFGAKGPATMGSKLVGGENIPKSTHVLHDVLKTAKPTPNKPNQLEVMLDDGSKVIFRRDIGEYAHEIKRGTGVKVDHYNVELQAPGAKVGRFNSIENLHIVVNKNLDFVEAFTSKNGALKDEPKLFNQPKP